MGDDHHMFQQLYVAYQETGDKIYRFAAEEIMRLRAENEKLRAALKPFAKYYTLPIFDEIRAARKALESGE